MTPLWKKTFRVATLRKVGVLNMPQNASGALADAGKWSVRNGPQIP